MCGHSKQQLNKFGAEGCQRKCITAATNTSMPICNPMQKHYKLEQPILNPSLWSACIQSLCLTHFEVVRLETPLSLQCADVRCGSVVMLQLTDKLNYSHFHLNWDQSQLSFLSKVCAHAKNWILKNRIQLIHHPSMHPILLTPSIMMSNSSFFFQTD
jgi:hypothetical protein